MSFQLLDSQEQLAVSVSTDRKKQIMIEQLDNVRFPLGQSVKYTALGYKSLNSFILDSGLILLPFLLFFRVPAKFETSSEMLNMS